MALNVTDVVTNIDHIQSICLADASSREARLGDYYVAVTEQTTKKELASLFGKLSVWLNLKVKYGVYKTCLLSGPSYYSSLNDFQHERLYYSQTYKCIRVKPSVEIDFSDGSRKRTYFGTLDEARNYFTQISNLLPRQTTSI
jgi:hypothetical protein